MIRVRRWLDWYKVREMCIRYNYYTRGDNEAYSNMLSKAKNADADDYQLIKQIAMNIYDHSTTSRWDDTDFNLDERVAGIMYGLLTECTEMYVELENEVRL